MENNQSFARILYCIELFVVYIYSTHTLPHIIPKITKIFPSYTEVVDKLVGGSKKILGKCCFFPLIACSLIWKIYTQILCNWRSQISVLLAPLRVASNTAFAILKSTIDTSNSSNTVLLFLNFVPCIQIVVEKLLN
jgi:hypothetical protein